MLFQQNSDWRRKCYLLHFLSLFFKLIHTLRFLSVKQTAAEFFNKNSSNSLARILLTKVAGFAYYANQKNLWSCCVVVL